MTSPLVAVWLGIMSLSLFTLTVLVALLALDMRRTLRAVQAMAPLWAAVGRDAHHILSKTGALVEKADRGAEHVAQVVHEACDTAHGALAVVKRSSRHFATNGTARSGPRHRS